MKKINYVFFTLFVAFIGLFFTSCEKEQTETNMIVRNWILESKTIAGIDVATDCEKSAKWNFKTDGTYAIYDSCDETKTGVWSLNNDATTLILDDLTAYKVLENSLLVLVIEMQVADIGLVKWSFK
ncbi:MAG: lipocalin family protein [Bacteroidales bacterium]|nr:lipocalin family protein [Bacteroidales bacterium]